MAPRASSPILYPPSSSPGSAGKKRQTAHDVRAKPTKPLARGGFLVDDDSDGDDMVSQPPNKKRMTANDHEKGVLDQVPQPSQLQRDDESQESEPLATPPDSQPSQNTPTPNADPYEQLFGMSRPEALFSSLGSLSEQKELYRMSTCAGKRTAIRTRVATTPVAYETMVAARSKTKDGRARRSYYGIEVHELVQAAAKELAEKRESAASADPSTHASVQPDQPVRSVEDSHGRHKGHKPSMLWTEKYRARNFRDLVGDDLTNRQVLRWLKGWDPTVFPHTTRPRRPAVRRVGTGLQSQQQQEAEDEKPHRKILLLTGPPGLGKTTLAHVCARQAGYEVMEINASDDRSRDVVRGRIRTSLGTENVKTVENNKQRREGERPRVARPVCVVVDEVDGAVTGAGGSGEGGFVKALIDLVLLGQKNGTEPDESSSAGMRKRNKGKTDDFRQMRPLILICNDVYHPALRPLRQSGLAEIIHVGKPTFEAVVVRLKTVFEQESIPCEQDAARKLCEAAWGMASGINAKRGRESTTEGDLRGVMVVGEWVAGRLRATDGQTTPHRLTRQWVEQNVLHELAHGGGGARGIGRGGLRDVVTRIFQEGAGFPAQALLAAASSRPSKNVRHELPQAQLGFSEQQKRHAMERLREMIETGGDTDRVVADIFTEYPAHEFNDDSFLSKPDAAYEWLHFHDSCSTRLFAGQEWELAPYLSQAALACHHLFASPHRHNSTPDHHSTGYGGRKWGAAAADGGDEAAAAPQPFSGPRADYAAFEAERANRAALQGLQAQLPPALTRAFRGPEHVATDLLPYLVRLVAPDVKPVIVGGSGDRAAVASVRREGERAMVRRAAAVLADVGIALQKGRLEGGPGGAGPAGRVQWVYRMEPDLDSLATFETGGSSLLSAQAPTRYAVRQVLDQELQKTIAQRETAARQARFQAGLGENGRGEGRDGISLFVDGDKENMGVTAKDSKAAAALGPIVKRDFFGRVIQEAAPQPLQDIDANSGERKRRKAGTAAADQVWVTFHEGLNNAVKKPISLEEFLHGL